MVVMTDSGAHTRDGDVWFGEAAATDLPEILRVQRAGFARVAAALGIPPERLPPLRETLAELEHLAREGVRFFVARDAEGVVGTVRAEQRPDGVVEVGRLAVDDGQQRRGIGSALMRVLEGSYPHARRFELFTGADACAALALYAKLGYTLFRTDVVHSVPLVWLAKDRC
jgi:GNAT superfamily N-acetyltransferase